MGRLNTCKQGELPMSSRLIIVSFVALVVACSGSGPTLSPIPPSFEGAVVDASDEMNEHLARLADAETMDDVMNEAARHGATADDLHYAMRGYIISCAAASGLMPVMNGLEATGRGHQSSLAGAANVGEARRHAVVYSRGVGELLNKLSDGWQSAGCP
jgi:hypothetical protein